MKTRFNLKYGKDINGNKTVTLTHDNECIARSIQTNGNLPLCHRYNDLSGLAECIAYVKEHGTRRAKEKLHNIKAHITLVEVGCGEYKMNNAEKQDLISTIGGRGTTVDRLRSIVEYGNLASVIGSRFAERFYLEDKTWRYYAGQCHLQDMSAIRQLVRNS